MAYRTILVPGPGGGEAELRIRLDYSEKEPFRVVETPYRLCRYRGGFFMVRDEESGKWGVLNREGEIVITPQWDSVEIWPQDGPAEVFRLICRESGGIKSWAFADTEGELCSPFMTGEFLGFREGIGLIRTERDERYGEDDYRDSIDYIDRTGKQLFSRSLSSNNSYYSYPLYHEGIQVVSNEDFHYEPHDASGEWIGVKTFHKMEDFSEGLAAAGKSRLLHPGTYSYGFVDKRMNWVIRPQYDDVCSFCNGYAGVEKNGKWGLVDQTGRVCIPLEWEQLSDVGADGLVFGRREGKSFLMTPEGKSVIPLPDDVIGCCRLTEGLLGIRHQDDSHSYLDRNGKTVLFDEGNWDAMSEFTNGVAPIRKKSENNWHLIDYSGQEFILPCEVDSCTASAMLYGSHHIVHYGCAGLGTEKVDIPVLPDGFSGEKDGNEEQALFLDSGWQVGSRELGEQALTTYLQRLEKTGSLSGMDCRLLCSSEECDVFLYAFQCADRSKVTSLTVTFGEKMGQQVCFDVLAIVCRTDCEIRFRLVHSREIQSEAQ